MNILVCSKVSIPAKDRTLPAWEYLRSMGHTVWVEHPHGISSGNNPDVIISMGVTVMEETFEAIKRWPGAPLFCYNWDCYEWVWTKPRPGEYDYSRYGDLLRKATEIWVPSKCTGERTTQWWGLKNWHVILSAAPYWDYDDVKDERYVLCPLREIPDPWWGVFEKACTEAQVPYLMTMHEKSYEEYQRAVAHCSFICSPLYELSTGGLTLLEGYYLGKPCLLSDSPWHGGVDYMGSRAAYFDHRSFEDFVHKLRTMYELPFPMPHDHKEWVAHEFSDQRMINDMVGRIKITVSTRGE